MSVSEQMSQKIHEYLKDMGLTALSREKKAFFYKPTSDHCQERELIVASLLSESYGGGDGEGWQRNMEGEKVDTSLEVSCQKPFKAGIIIGKVFGFSFLMYNVHN